MTADLSSKPILSVDDLHVTFATRGNDEVRAVELARAEVADQ